MLIRRADKELNLFTKCSRDAVMALFNEALKQGKRIELWVQNYTEGGCPAQIKQGARLLVSAFAAFATIRSVRTD